MRILIITAARGGTRSGAGHNGSHAGIAVGVRRADHTTPLNPPKLALTSPLSGGRTVVIVRLWIKSTELLVWDGLRTGSETERLEAFVLHRWNIILQSESCFLVLQSEEMAGSTRLCICLRPQKVLCVLIKQAALQKSSDLCSFDTSSFSLKDPLGFQQLNIQDCNSVA
jgi:hypothetical protein